MMQSNMSVCGVAALFLATITSIWTGDLGSTSQCLSCTTAAVSAPNPATAKQAAAGPCGDCETTWDGSRYIITAGCDEKDCVCDVPATTTSITPSAGATATFACFPKGENATAERFFLDLCGKGTGIHHLRFDKSQVEMFSEFNVVVRQGNKSVWEIDAKWNPASYKDVPVNNGGQISGKKAASVVLRCDTDVLGDMSQTVTMDKSNTITFEFGAWQLNVKYVGP